MNNAERRLGDPMNLPREMPADCPTQKLTEPLPRRAGDSGLGVPEFEPERSRPLSAEEKRAHQAMLDEQLRQKAEVVLSDLERGSGWELPRPVRHFCSAVLVLMAALLGLFLVTQFVQFAAAIQSLPPWGRWLATGSLLLFGGLLVFWLLKIGWALLRLRRSPRLCVKALRVLGDRKRMQRVAAERQADARELLETYLQSYPLVGKDRRPMRALGLSERECDGLLAARDRLLDSSRPLAPGDWLDEFQQEFQGRLDEWARRRIRQYAFRVGAGTAASPVALIDQMIVLYACTALVKDLFTIYHLRPAWGQAVLILARSVVQTYLSGVVEEAAELAVDSGSDALANWLGEGADALPGVIGRAAGAKTAEGVLNGWLLVRLGRRCAKSLQPVRL